MSSIRAPRNPRLANSARAAAISASLACGSAGRAIVEALLTRRSVTVKRFLTSRSEWARSRWFGLPSAAQGAGASLARNASLRFEPVTCRPHKLPEPGEDAAEHDRPVAADGEAVAVPCGERSGPADLA